MLIFSIPTNDLPTTNLDRPYRYTVRINGKPETLEINADTATVTIDPDGRRDQRRIFDTTVPARYARFIAPMPVATHPNTQ